MEPNTSESFFNNPEFSDIRLLLVEEGTNKEGLIFAHKVILAGRSPFFRRIFRPGFKESETDILKLIVSNLANALKLIEWMYNCTPFIPEGAEKQAMAWLIIEKQAIPYPGIRSRFIFKGLSEYPHQTMHLVLTYKSSNSDALIQEFRIQKYKRGNITLFLDYTREDQKWKDYLKQHNVDLSDLNYDIGYKTLVFGQEPEDFKIILSIIFDNNTFQPGEIERIRDFIADQITLD